MTVACLAWGSLVWNPGELPIDGRWHSDGPGVQVEYLRQSKDGRLTLVLEASASIVPALWARMQSNDLPSAVTALAARENIGPKSTPKFIGSWSKGQTEPDLVHGLADWAYTNDIEHVIWTALPPFFDGQQVTATKEQALSYLRGLSGEAKEKSEQYVRMTPSQVRTRYRRVIEETLHWVPVNPLGVFQ